MRANQGFRERAVRLQRRFPHPANRSPASTISTFRQP